MKNIRMLELLSQKTNNNKLSRFRQQ